MTPVDSEKAVTHGIKPYSYRPEILSGEHSLKSIDDEQISASAEALLREPPIQQPVDILESAKIISIEPGAVGADKDMEIRRLQLELERLKSKVIMDQKPFLFTHQVYMDKFQQSG